MEKNDFDFTIEGFCKCGMSLDRHTGVGCLFRPASPIKYEPIDVCDVVRHVPSGENWVVACVDGDRLYWAGYPYGGSAALSDCQLVTKASSEDRQKLLVKLAELTGFDVPTLRARARLTKRALDGACTSCKLELTPRCPIRTGNGCDLYQPRQ